MSRTSSYRYASPAFGGGGNRNESNLQDQLDEQKKWLEKLLVERRRDYFCDKDFVQLADIPTWPEYYEENQRTIDSWREQDATHAFFDDLVNQKVSLYRGDITKLEVDAIVNAANESLLGGGGVDGAIHSAAGRRLLAECRSLNGCDIGDAKITYGYDLPAKHVIATVGPRNKNEAVLQSCYEKCLQLMLKNELRSIAFPCISTGIYGYPNGPAARTAIRTVRKFLEKHGGSVDRVIFCLFMREDVEHYHALMPMYFPVKRVAARNEDPSDESFSSPQVDKERSGGRRNHHQQPDDRPRDHRGNNSNNSSNRRP